MEEGLEKSESPSPYDSAGCWDRDGMGWRLGAEALSTMVGESQQIIGGTGRQDLLSGFFSMSCFFLRPPEPLEVLGRFQVGQRSQSGTLLSLPLNSPLPSTVKPLEKWTNWS